MNRKVNTILCPSALKVGYRHAIQKHFKTIIQRKVIITIATQCKTAVAKALFTLPELCRNSTDMSDQRCMWTRYVGNKTWPYFGKLNPLKRRISVPAQLFVPEQVQCERGLYLCRREVALPIGHHKLCDRKWPSIYLFIVNSLCKY